MVKKKSTIVQEIKSFEQSTYRNGDMYKRKINILIRYYYTYMNEKNILILFLVSWIVERGVPIFSSLNVARAAACKYSLLFRNSRTTILVQLFTFYLGI